MAEEAYIVAFDIKNDGSQYLRAPEEKLGAAKETSIGAQNYEASSSLASQGINAVANAKLVEVKSNSAAEAVAVVRERYGSNATSVRAVVKPNTNFKVIT